MHRSNRRSLSKWKKRKLKIDFSKGIKSPIEMLNGDVFFAILSSLNFSDRMRIERVSQKWQQLSQESWHKVKKFDFSIGTWGILPKKRSRDSSPTRWNVLPQVVEKVLTLSANSLTHCDFSINAKIHNDDKNETLIELSEEALSEFFKSCRNLKWLKIVQNDWVKFSVMSLINLETKMLEELDLDVYCGNEMEIAFRKILRKIFQQSSRLHTFKMWGIKIVPDDLDMIVDKGTLKFFDLSLNIEDTTKIFQCLTKFKNLEHLELYYSNDVTDGLLKAMVDNCKKLKFLFIEDGLLLTDRSLLHLKSLPDLEDLELFNCDSISDINLHYFLNLKNLSLPSRSVKDEGVIKLLNSSQKLEKLWLDDTGITIDCLKAANEAVEKRTNGFPLEIIVNEDLSHPDLENISPLLKIKTYEPWILG